MDKDKMLEYAYDLRSDLKYAFEQGEGQTPNHKDVAVMDWLLEQVKRNERTIDELEESLGIARASRRDLLAYTKQLKEEKEKLSEILRVIYNLSITEINAGYEIRQYLESRILEIEKLTE